MVQTLCGERARWGEIALEFIRRLRNWKPDADYIQELQDSNTSSADAMQQLWNVCDGILRIRMNVATVLVAVGSALMAISLGILSQLGRSTGAESSQAWLYTNGWVAAVTLLVAAFATYFAAWQMFNIVTKVADYYQDEVRGRWLQQED